MKIFTFLFCVLLLAQGSLFASEKIYFCGKDVKKPALEFGMYVDDLKYADGSNRNPMQNLKLCFESNRTSSFYLTKEYARNICFDCTTSNYYSTLHKADLLKLLNILENSGIQQRTIQNINDTNEKIKVSPTGHVEVLKTVPTKLYYYEGFKPIEDPMADK